MDLNHHDQIRAQVRDHYGNIAQETAGTRCATGCCGATPDISLRIGYSAEELAALPEGANLGLGCGRSSARTPLMPCRPPSPIAAG